MTAVRRRAATGAIAVVLLALTAMSGCAPASPEPSAAPAACPASLVEFYETVGAVLTETPDPAIYPESAPTPSCSFYFEPQDSTSIVIAEADEADFDAVVAALESAGYTLSERIENPDPAPGDAHLQVQMDDGPATGVLLLAEPDPTAGFDSVSVVMLAVPST